MTDYRTMYAHLFNAITDALEIMGRSAASECVAASIVEAACLLEQAQRETEWMYIEAVGDDR